MHILLTGGAGFIGSHTAEKLLEKGHTVYSFDNYNLFYSPQRKHANQKKAIEVGGDKFQKYQVDIRNYHDLKPIFRKHEIDCVLHLAAQAGVRQSIENPKDYLENNIIGTHNILEMIKEFDIKHLVFASSSSVYGNRTDAPFRETDCIHNPASPYAATKIAGEAMCAAHHNIHGTNTAVLRFFTVYGPRNRPDMGLPNFVKAIQKGDAIRLFNNGDNKRDYTYIDDIVGGIVAAVENPLKFEVFNLGNNVPTTTNRLVELLEKELGKKANSKLVPPEPGDVGLTCADITKAKVLLGYNPKTPLEEGIKKFVEWHIENDRIG